MSPAPGPGDVLVREVRRLMPSALGDLIAIRADVLERGVRWPAWCWCPMAATTNIVIEAGLSGEWIAAVHAVAVWRLDRAVVELDDAAVADAAARVRNRSPEQVPTPAIDALDRALPGWCPYVRLTGTQVRGMWVHLEHDANTGRPELRLVVDQDATAAGLVPLVVYLDRPTLGRAAADMIAVAHATNRAGAGLDLAGLPTPESEALADIIWGLLPVVLALADDRYELRPDDTAPPAPGRASGDWKAAPVDRLWRQVPRGRPGPRRLHVVRDANP